MNMSTTVDYFTRSADNISGIGFGSQLYASSILPKNWFLHCAFVNDYRSLTCRVRQPISFSL